MYKDRICDDLELSGVSHAGSLSPTTPASRGTPNPVYPAAVTDADGRGSYLAPGPVTQESYEEVDDEPMQYEPVDDVPTPDKVGRGTAMVLVARHHVPDMGLHIVPFK